MAAWTTLDLIGCNGRRSPVSAVTMGGLGGVGVGGGGGGLMDNGGGGGADKMLTSQSKLLFQLNKFYNERVQARRLAVAKNVREVAKVVHDVLKEVELQEPRFISTLVDVNGHYEGLHVHSPTDYEVNH